MNVYYPFQPTKLILYYSQEAKQEQLIFIYSFRKNSVKRNNHIVFRPCVKSINCIQMPFTKKKYHVYVLSWIVANLPLEFNKISWRVKGTKLQSSFFFSVLICLFFFPLKQNYSKEIKHIYYNLDISSINIYIYILYTHKGKEKNSSI